MLPQHFRYLLTHEYSLIDWLQSDEVLLGAFSTMVFIERLRDSGQFFILILCVWVDAES